MSKTLVTKAEILKVVRENPNRSIPELLPLLPRPYDTLRENSRYYGGRFATLYRSGKLYRWEDKNFVPRWCIQ